MKTRLSLIALMASAGIAQAHVSIAPTHATGAAPAQTLQLGLSVGHGCDGAATDRIETRLPQGVRDPVPADVAGWTATVTQDGATRRVIWTGGPLDAHAHATFAFDVTLAADLAPDAALRFDTRQTCGAQTIDWAGGDGDHPAPVLQLAQGSAASGNTHGASDHGHADMGQGEHAHADMQGHDMSGHATDMAAEPKTPDPMAMAPVQHGDLTLSSGFARATLPNAPVAGAFLTITNGGDVTDRLISVETPAAARAEIHEMAMQGDVMVMRPLAEGIAIAPGAVLQLAPGGYHLMLMDLAGPLIKGKMLDITLNFERAGPVALSLPIGAPNAGTMAHDHMAPMHDNGHATAQHEGH